MNRFVILLFPADKHFCLYALRYLSMMKSYIKKIHANVNVSDTPIEDSLG